jgi:hypothetical protein
MNAYLLTALRSQLWQGRTNESCSSLIIYGGEEVSARKAFEDWLLSPNYGENPIPTKVIKIIGAPVMDHLLTETDSILINWDEICQEAQKSLDETAEDTGQGYWVDCDSYVKLGALSPDIELLRRDLPEAVAADLNWSGDKTYFFLVSLLSPPPPPAQYAEEPEAEGISSARDPEDQASEDPLGTDSAAYGQSFPELTGRELAILARARNSVVAAWLWKRCAVTTLYAGNSIRVDGWCGAVSIDDELEGGSA